MNRKISKLIFAALDEANRPMKARREDTWEHPDAWKIDRAFNRSFLAACTALILIATIGAFFSPKSPAENGHRGRAKTGQYCGVSATEYDAGKGDDTNF